MKITLEIDRTPGLKTGTVWATLPGTTDEQVLVVAHRDGWFEGANDNAAGRGAPTIGLAEYFAEMPKAQRRRTIVFLGTTGHHNSTAESGTWFAAHPEVFDKTALLLNCRAHGRRWRRGAGNIRLSNAVAAFSWWHRRSGCADIVVIARWTRSACRAFRSRRRRLQAKSAATTGSRRRSRDHQRRLRLAFRPGDGRYDLRAAVWLR